MHYLEDLNIFFIFNNFWMISWSNFGKWQFKRIVPLIKMHHSPMLPPIGCLKLCSAFCMEFHVLRIKDKRFFLLAQCSSKCGLWTNCIRTSLSDSDRAQKSASAISSPEILMLLCFQSHYLSALDHSCPVLVYANCVSVSKIIATRQFTKFPLL